ncbi:MAG: hypothetical protein LQ338_000553 [Usnochroma carphineum]|nr:MAG: hypothetical protein LQ338_000553 [Usnochroma carphineum]
MRPHSAIPSSIHQSKCAQVPQATGLTAHRSGFLVEDGQLPQDATVDLRGQALEDRGRRCGSPIGYIDVIDGTETKEGWDEIEDRRDGGMDSKEPHVMELLEDAREKR